MVTIIAYTGIRHKLIMKIALVKLSALGDIVHAMIVLQFIKKHFINAQVDWFVEAGLSGILENNPHISNIYPINFKAIKKSSVLLLDTIKTLRTIAKKNQYDIVIDLQGLIKSAIVSKLLGKNVIGFDKKSLREPLATLMYTKTFSIPYSENIIIRNLTLVAQALNFTFSMADILQKEPFLFYTSSHQKSPELLIIVGSSWASKIYPKEHFVTLINALHVKTFIAWGNAQEQQDAHYICEHTNATLLPKLSLDELKNVIAHSHLVIGGDSGPTHMAWALGRPSITIFGPTPSHRNTLTTPINITIDCQKVINPRKLDKNDFCIRDIDPLKIVTLAKELISC